MGLLKSALTKAIEAGLPLPHAYDPATKLPSFRLLVAYTLFLAVVVSLVWLHVRESALVAFSGAAVVWALGMVFYMLKDLTKAKIDLDDRSVDLESSDSGKNNAKTEENP